MQIANRESFAAASRSRMVDVEWLACTATGKEWVDTGFIPSSVTDVLTVDAAYTGTGNTFGCLFGVTSRVNGTQRFYQINKTTTSNQFRLITSTGDQFWTKTPEFSGARHSYVLDKNVLYIDGTQTVTGSGTSAETATLYLFARNNRSTSPATIDTYQAAWRIYSVKLRRNGVTQFDLKPVRIGSVGYFYDKVSGALLPSGGDPLVVGPDKTSWTNPYITSGLVAMWDGEWNAGGGKHTTDVLQMSPVVGDGVHMTVDPDYYGNTNVSITGNAVAVSGGGQFRLRDIATPTGELTLEYVVANVTLGPTIWGSKFGSFCQLGNIGFYNQLFNGQTAMTITRNGGYVSGNFFQTAFSTYAIVYNASNAVTRYVVNGVQKTLGTRTGTGTYTRGPDLTLSCQYGGSGVFFAARVYDRALTVTELASNYAIDTERFNTP